MTAEYPQVESKFYLDMPLPYEVNESSGNAKFDKACICMSRWLSNGAIRITSAPVFVEKAACVKAKHTLTLELPVWYPDDVPSYA